MEAAPRVMSALLLYQGDPLFNAYEEGTYANNDILLHRTMYNYSEEQAAKNANQSLRLEVKASIKLGNLIYERTATITLPENERQVIESTVKHTDIGLHNYKTMHYTFAVRAREWQSHAEKAIRKLEKSFCLTEADLLKNAADLLTPGYAWSMIKHQVKIADRIADAIIFVEEREFRDENDPRKKMRIIGLEAKADTDSYARLYDQIDTYQLICDEVYLVLQTKDPPLDLPRHVGVIRVIHGHTQLLRPAQRIKHDVTGVHIWGVMKDLLTKRAKLQERGRPRAPFYAFFNAVDEMKRKIIWNQIVVGWHEKVWDERYKELDDVEKAMITAYVRATRGDANDKGKNIQGGSQG